MRVLPCNAEAIRDAVVVLRRGGTIVYPTETAYGLGADPLKSAAVTSVFAIKGRTEGKPLGMIVDSLATAERFCVVTDEERELAKQYWPGPLSLVMQARMPHHPQERRAWEAALGNNNRVSVRVPGLPWARNLAETFGRPIITTSANRSGAATCYSLACVEQQFAHAPQPDLLLDGGTLQPGHLSTVVLVKDGTIQVLRQGDVHV